MYMYKRVVCIKIMYVELGLSVLMHVMLSPDVSNQSCCFAK